jgi:peroxiredoxin Q/BCP
MLMPRSLVLPALFAVALVLAVVPKPVLAELASGSVAPEFTAQAALGGDVKTVDLKAALANGPVVLYFFPKSFSSGCTVEAHLFSEHIADYQKLGATVIGVSGDPIDEQKKFSIEACRSTFLVASDPGLTIAKQYDAIIKEAPQYANRISYVIAPNGKIVYAYSDLDPSLHVQNTLNALQALKAK